MGEASFHKGITDCLFKLGIRSIKCQLKGNKRLVEVRYCWVPLPFLLAA